MLSRHPHTESPPPRVLHLCSWYPSPSNPFLGNFIQRHIAAVAPHTQSVSLSIHPASYNTVNWNTAEGFDECRVYYRQSIPILSGLLAWRKGIKHLNKRGFNPELLHLHVAYPALWPTLFSRLPHFVTEHFSGYQPISGFRWSWWKRFLVKRCLRRAECVFPVSEHLGRAIRNFAPGAKTLKLSNVVDTRIFYPKTEREGDRFRFLHVSTLEERSKNIKQLIAGFELLYQTRQDFLLEIGGDGDIDQLRRALEASGIGSENYRTFGHQKPEEIAERMRACDAFVLFSRFENQPCVILEALVTGLPVLSSDVGGIAEEINDQNGLLVTDLQTEALAVALAQMIDGHQQFATAEISAIAREKYSYESIGKQLLTHYLNARNAVASNP